MTISHLTNLLYSKSDSHTIGGEGPRYYFSFVLFFVFKFPISYGTIIWSNTIKANSKMKKGTMEYVRTSYFTTTFNYIKLLCQIAINTSF